MSSLPPSCGIAFKEWAGVCDALMDGRQSIIVRKGGIEEGPGEFAPEHPYFWLYPTHVHQAEQGIRTSEPTRPRGPQQSSSDRVKLEALAKVELVEAVSSEQILATLTPLHVWTEESILKRFRYRRPGLWVLGVRIYRSEHPTSLVPTAEQLGCKSWVELDPSLATSGLLPVLPDHVWSDQMRRLRGLLASGETEL